MSNKLSPGWFKAQVALAEDDVAKWPKWLKCAYTAAVAIQTPCTCPSTGTDRGCVRCWEQQPVEKSVLEAAREAFKYELSHFDDSDMAAAITHILQAHEISRPMRESTSPDELACLRAAEESLLHHGYNPATNRDIARICFNAMRGSLVQPVDPVWEEYED